MAHLTVEVPDDLALRLESGRDRLIDILTSGYQAVVGDATAGLNAEVVDFLASGPSSEEIIAFQPSQKSLTRVSALLDKNRQVGLSTREEAELDQVESLDYLMIQVKARARAHLQDHDVGMTK